MPDDSVVILGTNGSTQLGVDNNGTMIYTPDGTNWTAAENLQANALTGAVACAAGCIATLAYYCWKGCGWGSIGYLTEDNFGGLVSCFEAGWADDDDDDGDYPPED